MSILGSTKYLIEHYSDVSAAPPMGTYVGDFETLRRSISTTWSKVPHIVTVKDNDVIVTKEGTQEMVAIFSFKPFTSVELPDHF